MNVSGINSGTVNLESLLSQLGEVTKTTDVKTGKEMLTLSVRSDSVGGNYTVNFPKIDQPQVANSEALDSLVGKLKTSGGLNFSPEQYDIFKTEADNAFTKTVKSVNTAAEASGTTKSSKSTVLFDIYSLMALLVEVAQKQKEANRETRLAQNTAIQKAIQDQADQQRAAAEIGLLVGVICGAVAVVASAAMLVGQSVAANRQQHIAQNSGISAGETKATALAHADTVEHAQTKLATVEAKVGNEVSTRVKNDFSTQLVDDQAGDLAQNFQNARANLAQANDAKVTAENNLTTAKSDLATAQAEQRTAQTAYDAAHAENSNATPEQKTQTANALDAANQRVNAAQAEVNTKQNDVNLANQTIAQAETNFKNAKADYAKTIQDIGDQYGEKYQTALERKNNPLPGADEAQLDADVQSAKAEMEMARAYEASLLAADDVMTPSEQKTMVQQARAEANAEATQVFNRADYKKFEQRIQSLAGWNGIITSLGQMGQSIAQGVSSMQSAEATKMGAEEKKQEENLDQTKELYNEQQKLIDAVIQLMQAVRQAENQSMRDAIQA